MTLKQKKTNYKKMHCNKTLNVHQFYACALNNSWLCWYHNNHKLLHSKLCNMYTHLFDPHNESASKLKLTSYVIFSGASFLFTTNFSFILSPNFFSNKTHTKKKHRTFFILQSSSKITIFFIIWTIQTYLHTQVDERKRDKKRK